GLHSPDSCGVNIGTGFWPGPQSCYKPFHLLGNGEDMTAEPVYRQGWKLEDVSWDAFQPEAVDPIMLAAIKAAALVEYNAPDYVTYLKRVFHDAGSKTLADIERWGIEESQHGRALGRWAETADPNFRLEEAFARFRKGDPPDHFADLEAEGSVRGSRRAEMVARCVVESG